MLRELRISNFIIIDEQTISFGSGFNAISGESGAGKSVVLQALEFVLGRRSSPAVIRDQSGTAEVQALFDLEALPAAVREELPDSVREAGSELLLCRSIASGGRGKVHVNNRLGTVSLLQEIGRVLVTVSSQREYMRLLESSYHLSLIDTFAENSDLLGRYAPAYERWSLLNRELTELEQRINQSVFRRSELEAMVGELGNAKIRPGMRGELEAQVKKVGAGEAIARSGQEAVRLLRGEDGPVTSLRIATTKLNELSRHDPEIAPLAQRSASLRAEVEELTADLARYLSHVVIDESKLSSLREELAEIARLERKYRAPDSALCELLRRAREELTTIDDPSCLDIKRKEVRTAHGEAVEIAAKLTESRRKAAKKLLALLSQELKTLGMAEARLGVRHEPTALGATGSDRLEIVIAANAGAQMKPLGEVASGGELSRFFLACRSVIGGRSGTPVLIFDEVDTGVSGKTARAVGGKLQKLADDAQVLCITHLPQVASLADHHFIVEKTVAEKSVVEKAVDKRSGKLSSSVVRELSASEKVDEIARMLAGYEITAAARESARELLASKVNG